MVLVLDIDVDELGSKLGINVDELESGVAVGTLEQILNTIIAEHTMKILTSVI